LQKIRGLQLELESSTGNTTWTSTTRGEVLGNGREAKIGEVVEIGEVEVEEAAGEQLLHLEEIMMEN